MDHEKCVDGRFNPVFQGARWVQLEGFADDGKILTEGEAIVYCLQDCKGICITINNHKIYLQGQKTLDNIKDAINNA